VILTNSCSPEIPELGHCQS